jgi:hypothetical protein
MRGSEGACYLGLKDRIALEVWLSLSYECCVLSGRGLCDEPIPRQEESYWVCVFLAECDQVKH